MIDKKYCMSSYLMYRTIPDRTKCFSQKYPPNFFEVDFEREKVHNSNELEKKLKEEVIKACNKGKTAIALSGGIDSAVLARFMPEGSTAYTFKCVVPGKDVLDETAGAKKYTELCGLRHEIVEIYWEDFEKYAPILMKHKGAPIHSIEVQIYKAAIQARKDGFEQIIFGESADLNYGGLSELLSKDWLVGEFINRYAYVMPYCVLREYEIINEPIIKHEKDGYVDVHDFCRTDFFMEAMGSYTNACETAGIKVILPYSKTFMGIPIDMERIRRGENKYWIREIFKRLYDGFEVPPKTPMPRPMNEWLADWKGPARKEFLRNCVDSKMTGDQKWLLFALEKFLNILEEDENA